jgi:hypothetical protein
MKARVIGSLLLCLAFVFGGRQRVTSVLKLAKSIPIPGLTLAAVFLAVVVVRPVAAQSPTAPRFDVAGGYSFLHDQDISENLPKGWLASFADNLTSWLGLVGEVGGNYKTLAIPGDAPRIRVQTVLGGPRLRAHPSARVTPFGQVLFGAAWARTSVLGVGDTVKDFAYQPGGGIDWNLRSNLGVRLEGDYRIVRAAGSNSKESRFVAAAVFGFGR